MLALASILILIAIGALLAAAGTAGFVLVWQQASSAADLGHARVTATAGRWMSAIGLTLFTLHHTAAGPGLAALLCVAALAVATLLTKSTRRLVHAP
jgi:hypothetical protein